MSAFSNRNASRPIKSADLNSDPAQPPSAGVHGWLLVLCLMLTVIGPFISAWLMTEQYATFAPYLAGSRGLQFALVASLLAATGSTLFGIYAGFRLWLAQVNAVNTAKIALLVGLAADILTTAIEVAAGLTAWADGGLLHQTLFHLVPSLIFFTLCFAYLQHSHRVHVTYAPRTPDA